MGAPGDQPERLHALMAEIFAAHGDTGADVPFTPALFPALERELGGAASVLLGYVGGELAGFFLFIQHGQTLLLPLGGGIEHAPVFREHAMTVEMAPGRRHGSVFTRRRQESWQKLADAERHL